MILESTCYAPTFTEIGRMRDRHGLDCCKFSIIIGVSNFLKLYYLKLLTAEFNYNSNFICSSHRNCKFLGKTDLWKTIRIIHNMNDVICVCVFVCPFGVRGRWLRVFNCNNGCVIFASLGSIADSDSSSYETIKISVVGGG